MKSQSAVEWHFSGQGASGAWTSWILLGLAAALGIGLFIHWYGQTLRKLNRGQQALLITLRLGFFICLLLGLANPSRVEKNFAPQQELGPLAVLVDHSGSMLVPDARGQTRLDQALRCWRLREPVAQQKFSRLDYLLAGSNPQPLTDLGPSLVQCPVDSQTHLYEAISATLNRSPDSSYGGLVCLTDGLDTTGHASQEAARIALEHHCPLYFAVGSNHLAPPENLRIRSLSVPRQVLQNAEFEARVLVEGQLSVDQKVPISLWVDQEMVAQTTLEMKAGANLIPWTTTLHSHAPGKLHVECHLGEGGTAEVRNAVQTVVDQIGVHLLYYQGELNWTYRFVLTALQRDPGFVVDSLINPGLKVAQVTSRAHAAPFTSLPENGQAYRGYDFLILADVSVEHLSAAQQAALADYVRAGGGVLMLISNPELAHSFSGTDLEAMLPVVFEAPPKIPDAGQTLSDFQALMKEVGGTRFADEKEVADDSEQQRLPPLFRSFALPPGRVSSKAANLFTPANGDKGHDLPQFTDYVRVHGLKAGSEVLAVHPDDVTDSGVPRTLLATERFGEGRVTTLLTDPLWRWKLSLPSTSHAPERFWQQLALALAHTSSPALQFNHQRLTAAIGENVEFLAENVIAVSSPSITAVNPQGISQNLSSAVATQKTSWRFSLTPAMPGSWRIIVRDDDGNLIDSVLEVKAVDHSIELSGALPDVEGLRRLAQQTGGGLLSEGVPGPWVTAHTSTPSTLLSLRTTPLWDTWLVLAFGLLCYATELVCRRRFQLL